MGGRRVLLQVLDPSGSRNRDDRRRAAQQPRDRHLRRAGAMPARYLRELSAPRSQPAIQQGEPRHEGQPISLTGGEDVFAGAFADAVSVLDGDDLGHAAGAVEILGGDIRDADVPDLALALRSASAPTESSSGTS